MTHLEHSLVGCVRRFISDSKARLVAAEFRQATLCRQHVVDAITALPLLLTVILRMLHYDQVVYLNE